MLDQNNNNNELVTKHHEDDSTLEDSKAKPHVIRRNIEDYLEQRALERRIKDIYDDDFLVD